MAVYAMARLGVPLAAVLLLAATAAAMVTQDPLALPGVNVTQSLDSSRKLQGFRAVPVDASVVLLGVGDVEGGGKSQCRQMVDRARQFRGRYINFFITYFYADDNNDGVVDRLGYRQTGDDKGFKQLTWNVAYRFAKGLSDCMRHAVNNNFNIAVHIHLDDGLNRGTWRNALAFNPSQKYGEVSYWEGVVRPAAEAVKDANYRKRQVYFAMQAEMGATLFYNPKAYKSMIGNIKRIVASTGTPANRVRVGVNVNWEKICGCPGFLINSMNYYNDLKSNWWRVKQSVNIKDVQDMFRSVDWIGVSAYAGLPEFPGINDLENSFRKVDQELGLFGLSLRGLGKELVFSEYGLGGGMTGDYKTPALNPAIVAASPYWGVDGPYDSSRDPWNRNGNRDFLRRFYDLTVQYARRGGVSYPVSAIFLWNIISYDVLGIHYYSTTKSGSYRSAYVASLLEKHNKDTRGN